MGLGKTHTRRRQPCHVGRLRLGVPMVALDLIVEVIAKDHDHVGLASRPDPRESGDELDAHSQANRFVEQLSRHGS